MGSLDTSSAFCFPIRYIRQFYFRYVATHTLQLPRGSPEALSLPSRGVCLWSRPRALLQKAALMPEASGSSFRSGRVRTSQLLYPTSQSSHMMRQREDTTSGRNYSQTHPDPTLLPKAVFCPRECMLGRQAGSERCPSGAFSRPQPERGHGSLVVRIGAP